MSRQSAGLERLARIMIIDAHQHFWRLDRGDYGWLTPNLEGLYRDYLPADLGPELLACGIDGTILVQAAPADGETDFLLRLAQNSPVIHGVVGWAALDGDHPEPRIETLAGCPKLKGLRPMIQDIVDPDWMLSARAGRGFSAIVNSGLRLDGLVRAGQIAQLSLLADRYPKLPIVLNHAGKPDIAGGQLQVWSADIQDLARRPNVACKLSGLLTEAGPHTRDDDLAPYVDRLLESFGPSRLMWGSDWPVLRLAGEYQTWHAQARHMLAALSADEQALIFGGVATAFYGLETTRS